jgi:hypothetical protein
VYLGMGLERLFSAFLELGMDGAERHFFWLEI